MENIQEKEPPDVISSDTNNATKIPVDEAPAHKKEKFKKFRAYNTGTWNGPRRENKEVTYNQDNLHRFDSISSSLSLTAYQKGRGRSLVEGFDFREFGLSVDHVLFGICAIVANADVEEGSRYYPHPEAAGDREFVALAESLNLDKHDQVSYIEKVRPRLNL
jgi:hypothetical protein